jgi:hypothetical protein
VVAAVLWQPERGLRQREYARWGIEREEDIAAAISASLNPPPSRAVSVSLSLSLLCVCISVSLSAIFHLPLSPLAVFLCCLWAELFPCKCVCRCFSGGGRARH